jgi:hypothetical protein
VIPSLLVYTGFGLVPLALAGLLPWMAARVGSLVAPRLTTETRVLATDSRTRRLFAAYWRLILPGSALMRRTWLAAIRRRAEGPA